MSRCSQSRPSVCPFSSCNRSSSRRRPGSASALNTLSSSVIIAPLCNLLVACQGCGYFCSVAGGGEELEDERHEGRRIGTRKARKEWEEDWNTKNTKRTEEEGRR